MKKCIPILLTVIPLVTWGQTLTLDELIKFQKSDFVAVNDILTSKGWDFSHSKKGDFGNYNTVTWAFEKNDFNEATGWLTLYTAEDSENILSYQMHSSRIYNSIKTQIIEYKMKSISNSIEDNEISSVYQGQKYTITVSINSSEDKSNPHYVIGVISNDTYALIKLNEFLENIDQSGSDDSGDDKVNIKYGGSFLYKSKAFSYASVFEDIGLTERIYMVPPNHFVYIISELRDNKVRVFCNGKYGYMDKGMLNR